MASERYNAPVREKHWQSVWEERGTFRTQDKSKKPKRYQLEMFPYPSGRVHMGHVRNYTLGDVMARYMRAKGFNVLHPMGWDAFGLPAENAAMERKIHPRKWTYENIDTMRAQLKAMGLSIDWEREFATCDPVYYVHQQRLFLDFLKKKLAYRKTAKVNWDPVENTVLANEQVIDGRGWRSDAPVEQRDLTQWFFRITAFADELLAALDGFEGKWPDFVCTQQRNWIGRSTGASVTFALEGAKLPKKLQTLEIFTTRHDTLFGASFMAISPEHPLAAHLAKKNAELTAFIEECRRIGTTEEALAKAEKRGFDTGLVAAHPFRPDLKLPVYVANFIVMGYGTGAIFGCPAHDQRDLDFARKYARPVMPVVLPPGADPATFSVGDEAYLGEGTLINSEFLDGLTIEAAKEKMAGLLEERGIGARKVNYRLRDWLISRQRYWGCPIPVIHCEKDGIVPVPYDQLPVKLPGRRHLRPAGQSARPSSDLEARRMPEVRPAGRARDGHHGYVRRQRLVPVPLLRAQRRHADRQEGRQILGARRPVHRRQGALGPASALRPLLHARHEGDQAPGDRRAVRLGVHPGHRHPRDLPQRERRLADAGGSAHRRRGRGAQGDLDRHRPPGRDRPDREDVEVAQERGRSRRHHRPLRRRHGAAVHRLRQPARPRHHLDGGRRRRRRAAGAAHLPA